MSDAPKTPLSLYVYAILIVASVAFMGTALGTNHWIVIENPSGKMNIGLYETCLNGKCLDHDMLHIITGVHLDFDTSIALCITAIGFSALTMATMLHLVFVRRMLVSSRQHGWIALVLACIGAGCAWASVGHFRSELGLPNDRWSWGYSMYLAGSSGGAAFFAGCMTLATVSSLARQYLLAHNSNPQVVNAHSTVLGPIPPYAYPAAGAHGAAVYTVGPAQNVALNYPSYPPNNHNQQWKA